MNILSLYDQDSGVISYSNGEASMRFEMPDHEDGTALIVNNTADSAATVTVKAGNSIYAMGDLTVSVAASATAVINLKNSGRFKNVHGENSGKVAVTISGVTASLVKLCVIAL